MVNIGAGADRTAPLLVVCAALLDGAGRVLIQRRPSGKQHGGLWEFPGGKVEPGETPEAALTRELREELGIAISPDAARPVTFASVAGGSRPLVLLLYLVSRWKGEPRALESPELRWLRPGDMTNVPMPPADRPLVVTLQRCLTSPGRDHSGPASNS